MGSSIAGLLGWRTVRPMEPMGPPDQIANKSQTLANAFERTVAAAARRSQAEVEAQRRHILWQLLPRLCYHYGDLDADDAMTVALRHIRERIDGRRRAGDTARASAEALPGSARRQMPSLGSPFEFLSKQPRRGAHPLRARAPPDAKHLRQRPAPPPPPLLNSRRELRLALCYWGLTRSVRLGTHASHARHLTGLLNRTGLAYRTYMHTWDLPDGVQRVWYGAASARIDYSEPSLLAPHAFRRDNQTAFEAQLRAQWRSNGESPTSWNPTLVLNCLCELESIRRVFGMAMDSGWPFSHLVFVRPDVVLLNDLPLLDILGLAADEVALPRWGHNQGYNDQFAAMRRGVAASAWAERILDLHALALKEPAWQAETLVRHSLQQHRLRPRFIDFFFFRLRPDGQVHVSVGMATTLEKDILRERKILVKRGVALAKEPPKPTTSQRGVWWPSAVSGSALAGLALGFALALGWRAHSEGSCRRVGYARVSQHE